MKKLNKLKTQILFLLLACCLLLVTAPTASGQTMSNDNYVIETDSLETLDANSIQKNKAEPSTQKPNKNTVSAAPFSVSLSSDIIDFGILTPTNPIIRTLDLAINNVPPYGYSIIAFENHALKSYRTIIPDTTCDSGECGHENTGIWANPLSFGFGYRCDNTMGRDCDRSFSNSNSYKHFSDISGAQLPQSVIKGAGLGKRSVRLSYKVNISGNQEQGIYSNVITYIAIPNF